MKLPLTFCSVLALVAAAPALAAPTFNRVASFPTVANMAAGEDTARETSAEIMTATEDGKRAARAIHEQLGSTALAAD